MSGDFEYNDLYTPTIDDNLTEAQGRYKQRVGTRPEKQGVIPWCALMPRFWRHDVDVVWEQAHNVLCHS